MPTVTLTLGGVSSNYALTPPFSNYWTTTTIIGQTNPAGNDGKLWIVEANTFAPTFAVIVSATLNIVTAYAGHTSSRTTIALYEATSSTDYGASENPPALSIGVYGSTGGLLMGTYAVPLSTWPLASAYPYIGYYINTANTGGIGILIGVTSANVVVVYESIDVYAIVPDHGPIAGGTKVIISGDGFTTVSSVTIGGNAASHVTVVNSNTITCTTPPGAPSVYVDVVITATDGSIATLPASYQYRNVPLQWTVNGIPSVGGSPPTVPIDFNDPITVIGVPNSPLSIVYVPASGPPVTIVLDPSNPVMPIIPPASVVIVTGPPFVGSVPLIAILILTITNGSGIYVITPGATSDTLYINTPVSNATALVKFPDPFIKTAFLP